MNKDQKEDEPKDEQHQTPTGKRPRPLSSPGDTGASASSPCCTEAHERTQVKLSMAEADAWRPWNVVPESSGSDSVFPRLAFLVLPILQISLGAKYLRECTQQNYIPVYLVVSGVFTSILILFNCFPCSKEPSALKCARYTWNALVFPFALTWFITGSVWIYSIYPPNFNSAVTGVPYCDKTLYQFAFWTNTIIYIILALVLVIGCCYYMCMCVRKLKAETRVTVET